MQELRDAGYLPEAVRNYLALLGWGAADDETILSTEELVAQFDVERVSKNPARFDEQKLRWLNGRYLRELRVDELTARARGVHRARPGLREAVAISQEKIQTLADFWPLAGFLFDGPVDDPKAREKWLDADGRARARARPARRSPTLDPFDGRARSRRRCARSSRPSRSASPRTSSSRSASRSPARRSRPGIFESLAVLGRDETLQRIDAALATS